MASSAVTSWATKPVSSSCLERAGLPTRSTPMPWPTSRPQLDLIAEHPLPKTDCRPSACRRLLSRAQTSASSVPVVEPLPTGAEADTLWEHVRWMLEQPYLWEVKRERKVKLQPQHVVD